MDRLAQDSLYIKKALKEAEKAFKKDEVPVGAVVVYKGKIISRAHNTKEKKNDPTQHAELQAISKAARRLKSWRLNDCTLYVTLEPCIMCAGAILQARIGRLVYGAADPKAGAVESLYEICSDRRLNHQIEVTSGILQKECSDILKTFFKNKRRRIKDDKVF
ncbi:MAG: tRNA adenosine(34) deaminase TadA [Thermodesulfovibrionales bacterium]|nr:tRNA adenosine(34) deaminase TadA [Thermodesulfovibrionales bacterium]